MRTLLPLYVHPVDDPAAWVSVATGDGDLTVIVNVHNGPGAELEPPYVTATGRLAAAGVPMVGYVDVGYGRRPLPQVVADIDAWRRYPVDGIFLDQAPSAAEDVTTVAVAVRAAHRAGFDPVILNPGTTPAPVYRGLAVRICSFEGSWVDYQRRADDGFDGDGHLVYGVPIEEHDRAAALFSARRAGFGLITDACWPRPYARLPWLQRRAGAAGSADTRTTTGS